MRPPPSNCTLLSSCTSGSAIEDRASTFQSNHVKVFSVQPRAISKKKSTAKPALRTLVLLRTKAGSPFHKVPMATTPSLNASQGRVANRIGVGWLWRPGRGGAGVVGGSKGHTGSKGHDGGEGNNGDSGCSGEGGGGKAEGVEGGGGEGEDVVNCGGSCQCQ